ncbi:uncharacterized protein EDB91DRAFT_1088869 [Suillus paluster]|uniref:uncharacterized protein n=1 Tax=Suillus paluster TaxID=48578 RepID=UPI001B879011|nr:uncharacterized protein EDB91DRAFT_1088869 [Suillus paluster]KAG1720356.1 hypothetical protein EDB91DRAFT_1088869 [Suillus paluster]
MSQMQMGVLMREQCVMLKTFLPGYVLINSGTAEDIAIFWESVYSKWFETWPEHGAIEYCHWLTPLYMTSDKATLHAYFPIRKPRRNCELATRPRAQIGKTKVLLGRMRVHITTFAHVFAYLSKYHCPPDALIKSRPHQNKRNSSSVIFRNSCTHALNKHYKYFLKCVEVEWFQCWPKCKVSFPELPAEHVYTTKEEEQVRDMLTMQNEHVAQAAERGVFKFDAMLAGGVNLKGTHAPQKIDIYSNKYYDKKIKHAADNAIKNEHITNRGPKLNKHCEITCHMYSDESEVIKAKIDKKYKTIKVRYTKQHEHRKSELFMSSGPMLDRVLKYLGHMTGGWKFSVLMGGHDPSTGEVSVFNYHVGEVESGVQFDQVYDKFDVVQSAFLEFVKKSIAFESTLSWESESESESESDTGLLLLDMDSDKEWGKSGGEGGHSQLQEDPGNYLYRMTPQSDEGADLFPAIINASPTTTSDASFNVEATGHLTTMDHMDLLVLNPFLNDPIIQGSIDFSAFDPSVFSAVINDPTFNINMLGSPQVPPVNSHWDVEDNPYSSTPQTQEVFLPSVHSEEGEDSNDLNNSPAVPQARCRNHFDGTQVPAPSAEAPHLHAHNTVPFNPRECDNEIGTSTVAEKGKRKNAEGNYSSHKYTHSFSVSTKIFS